MSRPLGYADAARLLGGAQSPVVTALDRLTGGALLGVSVVVPAALALFDARAEFIRLSHELVRGLSERRAGLSRYARTERLAAAHRVIVVTAFFEALAEADLPFRFSDLELTEREQVAIAGAHGGDHQPLLRAFFADAVPAPGPQQPYERFRAALGGYYRVVADRLEKFVVGLAAWEWLGVGEQRSFQDACPELPARAVQRHQDLLGRLAVDFPEVAFWAALREHSATRAQVREVARALAGLERSLVEISTGRVPDERRAGLARAYAAELEWPIIASGEVPAGMRVPTLGAAYVAPLFRMAEVDAGARPSEESWWAGQPVREQLSDFLTGYLTSPGATEAPLLVLGQPGSGKSVLTRVLAARLPPADFLPVRVVLRDVPAAAALQDQIEYAVRAATGDRVDWPALARSAGDALPVVLLDGFDELLQATGVSQTDYLLRVAAFQRREADQGRPVVVVVTSRTSVADRAQPPDGTVALRLEPFDPARIGAWLANWNAVNADHFAVRNVAALELSTVLAHRELAEQPLLLLMLALYDADGNALRSAGALRRDELYERLLRGFARREVTKHRPGLPGREVDHAIEEELRRLAVVAFAMFNRNAQWVTEAQLEADQLALFGAPAALTTAADLRAPLRHAEIVLGRFFFVHRARASRDDSRLETYEFLHATFGEFLVARFTWQVLTDIAAREAIATMSLGAGVGDDDLLHALLSYAALSGRAPIIGFLRGLMSEVDARRRDALTDLLIRLFRAAHQPRPARRFDAYQPRPLPVPARHANYSANLLLLAACPAGTLSGSMLYPGRNVIACWHRETLLWESQLGGEDWSSLVRILALDRVRTDDGERDIILRIVTEPDDAPFTPRLDPRWTYALAPDEPGEGGWAHNPARSYAHLSHRAHFQCSLDGDLLAHALEPLALLLPSAISTVLPAPGGSLAHELTTLLLAGSSLPDEQRRDAYLRCFAMLSGPWADAAERHRLNQILLYRLATDWELKADSAVEVISLLHDHELVEVAAVALRQGPHPLVRDLALFRRNLDNEISIAANFAGLARETAATGPNHLAVGLVFSLAEGGFLTPEELARVRPEVEAALVDRPDLLARLRRAIGQSTPLAAADD